MKFIEGYTDRWIEALRSGRYPQGQDRLCTKDVVVGRRYCCLGVAGDILVQDGNAEWVDRPVNHGPVLAMDGVTYSTDLGPGMEDLELALPPGSKFGLDTDDIESLIALNDVERLSFAEIADHIERNAVRE